MSSYEEQQEFIDEVIESNLEKEETEFLYTN